MCITNIITILKQDVSIPPTKISVCVKPFLHVQGTCGNTTNKTMKRPLLNNTVITV